MNTQHDPNAKKFRQPRSWAAKWCGSGLAPTPDRPRTREQNGRKFAEPRGWSAKWSGGALWEGRDR